MCASLQLLLFLIYQFVYLVLFHNYSAKMATDWEEVKKLAFDFQRTQQMSSVQKLSERNCVDIVKRLLEMKLIDVIFTNDGKEYLTSDHLTREIENELYASGGRVAISDLVGILNVDYGHIESKANFLARNSSGGINIVLEQLISREYKDNLTSEIDLHLQETGSMTISELSKQYDLPAEFIMNLLDERLGVLIKGKLDKDARVIYTYDYIARYQSKVIGIFSAITRPVSLQTIVNRYNISEKILNVTLDELISKKRILGSISGPTYIPEIYSKNQQEYVNNFYKHNRYLDYSTLAKLGISNAQSFLQKKFGNELCYLETCAVDRLLNFQIETTIEDCIQNHSFVDLIEIMPSVLSPNDIDLLIKKTLEQNKTFSDDTLVLCDTIVTSNAFLEKIKEYFNDIKQKKAEEDLKSGALLNYFSRSKIQNKSENSLMDRKSKDSESAQFGGKKGKKSGGGGSGNTQGREVKTKAVKKKYRPGKTENKNEDDDNERVVLNFLDFDEIAKVLSSKLPQEKDLEDVSEQFIEALAQHICDDLQRTYENYAKDLFISHNTESVKSKKSFTEVQKFINETYVQIYLFDKGIQIISTDDLKTKLIKHLQKTLCLDILLQLISYFSDESVSTNVSAEARLKFISKLDPEIKENLNKINTSLSGNTIEEFLATLEQCSSKLDIMLKKIDKKKEKALLSEHRHLLILQLSECQDPILGLHISTMIAFQVLHDCMLHATGKFVPQILSFLEKDLDSDLYMVFKESQDLILQFVSTKEESLKNELSTKLNELFNSYKTRLVEYKKTVM